MTDVVDSQEVMRVPLEMMLTPERALAHPTVGKALSAIQIGDFATLAFYTLFERRQDEGKFSSWLRSIPPQLSVLAAWTDEELKLLTGSPVIEALATRRAGVNSSYFAAFRAFEQKGNADVFPAKDYPLEDYIWACNVIFQRAMTLQVPLEGEKEKPKQQAREVMALVPMIDFAKRSGKVRLLISRAPSNPCSNS